MKIYLLAIGIAVYGIAALAQTMMCPQPITYQLWVYGSAAIVSLPFLWLGVVKSANLLARSGGRVRLALDLIAIVACISVGFAYFTSGSDAECRAVKEKLEGVKQQMGGEQFDRRDLRPR